MKRSASRFCVEKRPPLFELPVAFHREKRSSRTVAGRDRPFGSGRPSVQLVGSWCPCTIRACSCRAAFRSSRVQRPSVRFGQQSAAESVSDECELRKRPFNLKPQLLPAGSAIVELSIFSGSFAGPVRANWRTRFVRKAIASLRQASQLGALKI